MISNTEESTKKGIVRFSAFDQITSRFQYKANQLVKGKTLRLKSNQIDDNTTQSEKLQNLIETS